MRKAPHKKAFAVSLRYPQAQKVRVPAPGWFGRRIEIDVAARASIFIPQRTLHAHSQTGGETAAQEVH
jgi:hypothetical protein